MKTTEEIKAYALEITLTYYFDNVGDPNWPDDPIAFLENGEFKQDGKEMVVWEPFANYNAEMMLELVLDGAFSYEAAIKWAIE